MNGTRNDPRDPNRTLPRTVDVRLFVGMCATGRVNHAAHICKPGGFDAWFCPGRGPDALENMERLASPFGAVTV